MASRTRAFRSPNRIVTAVHVLGLLVLPAACGADDARPPDRGVPERTTRVPEYTLATLGDRRAYVPSDWWVRQTRAQPPFFFASEPREQPLYHEWIDFGYDISLGDSTCGYIERLRPRLKLVKTHRKKDFGFACSWDMEVVNPHGDRYRIVAYASYPTRYYPSDRGSYAAYAARVEDFDRLQGQRTASLLAHGQFATPGDVAADGRIEIGARGAIRRPARGAEPAFRDIAGWRVLPDGWTLRFDPQTNVRTLTPNDPSSHTTYVDFQLTSQEQMLLRVTPPSVFLAHLLQDKGFDQITIAEYEPALESGSGHLLGHGIRGSLRQRGKPKDFLGFVDPKGALFLYVDDAERMRSATSARLFVTLLQGNPELMDLELEATAAGVNAGLVQSLVSANTSPSRSAPQGASQSARDGLARALRDQGAAQVTIGIAGGVNGGSW